MHIRPTQLVRRSSPRLFDRLSSARTGSAAIQAILVIAVAALILVGLFSLWASADINGQRGLQGALARLVEGLICGRSDSARNSEDLASVGEVPARSAAESVRNSVGDSREPPSRSPITAGPGSRSAATPPAPATTPAPATSAETVAANATNPASPASPESLFRTADTDASGDISHAEGVAYLRSLGGRYSESALGRTSFQGLSPAGLTMIDAAYGAADSLGIPLVITGAAERFGHSANSRHYAGDAIDVSPRGTSGAALRNAIEAQLRARGLSIGSGAGQYEVINEGNHVHVERNAERRSPPAPVVPRQLP